MSVSGISTTSSTTSTSTTDRPTIAENFDTFLSLLTTQLKNQNPLDPLDTNQFTQQMVQFTSVEQQLKTNDYLKALTLSTATRTSAEAVSFIGKKVSASGSTSELIGGSATWSFDAARDAPNSVITINDANGNTVFTDTTNISMGQGNYTWDGRDSSGHQVPDGTYSITIDARDDHGYIPVSTQMSGTVTGVDLSGDEPYLVIGQSKIPVSSVTTVGLS
ncbi:MAG: flagellar hook assembly protein FlgD [Hyphomicrobiaceae bacterium]|nr:flagellar hook assembly protein FlgD [Hyphomicrobiaceae bacterium]